MRINLLIAIFFPLLALAQMVETPETFFYKAGYKKGFKDGYKKGYKEGYTQAVKDFKTILEAYKEDIKALELGKYLFKEGYVSFPRVWRVNNGNEITYKVVGCRIEKTRSLEDIIKNPFVVPTINCQKLQEVQNATQRLIQIPNQPPSPQTATEFGIETKSVYTVKVKKEAIEILNKLGIPYEQSPDKKEIKAIFFDKKNLESFCKQYKVCE